MTCPRCGASRGHSDRYCADCGAPLWRCPSCGEPTSQGHRFCLACEHALAGAAPGSSLAAPAAISSWSST
ncbi:MAG: zinc ribbon domain-containing protein [Streptosporangiaceae bacterium]